MEITNISTENPNFGWNIKTHKAMTSLALHGSAAETSAQRAMCKFVQLPDLLKQEAGYHHNTHFFFPDCKNKSFGRDANGRNNALSMFKEHYQAAAEAKTLDDFLLRTGFAMHYLQDVTMPMHTEPGGVLNKILDYRLHKNFECGGKYGARANMQELTKSCKLKNMGDIYSPLSLFMETARFSQNPKYKVSRFNKGNWLKIQQECFDMGVSVSKRFFDIMWETCGRHLAKTNPL